MRFPNTTSRFVQPKHNIPRVMKGHTLDFIQDTIQHEFQVIISYDHTRVYCCLIYISTSDHKPQHHTEQFKRYSRIDYLYLKGLTLGCIRRYTMLRHFTSALTSHRLHGREKGKFDITDTDTGILPGITRKCNMRSKFR